MPPRQKPFLSFDRTVPLPWAVVVTIGVASFLINQHARIGEGERIDREHEKEIADIVSQLEADRKANQEIRESVIAFNGKLDTMNAKIDGLGRVLGVGSIKAEMGR